MRICTITCQHAYNYGARLQTFALADYLRQQGHEVQVIDYRPGYMRGDVQLLFWPGLSVKQWGKLLLQFPERLRAKIRQPYFDYFSKQYIPLTHRTYWSIDELRHDAPEADIYIAGSDQIWNTEFRNGTDPGYYLDFGSPTVRRISYAASFATKDILPSARSFVQTNLARFDAISVREHSALDIIKSLGYTATEVLDPVFLLPKRQWMDLADDTGNGEKYVLVYDFMSSPKVREEAKRIAAAQNMKIFTIGDKRLPYADRNFIYASPLTFLGLIKHASHIVSNSFHGTAFAIIFGIPYSVIDREDGLNIRMRDLARLDITLLNDMIVHSESFLTKSIVEHNVKPTSE